MMSLITPLFLFTLLMFTSFGVIRVSSMKSGRNTNGSMGTASVICLWVLLFWLSIQYFVFGDLSRYDFVRFQGMAEVLQFALMALYYKQLFELLTYYTRSINLGHQKFFGAD